MACEWEPVREFGSSREYERFQQRMEDQVASGLAARVPVQSPYSGSSLWEEHWYECLSDRQVWRLVAPDPPFKGIFKPVALQK